jgi:hypothetical protein
MREADLAETVFRRKVAARFAALEQNRAFANRRLNLNPMVHAFRTGLNCRRRMAMSGLCSAGLSLESIGRLIETGETRNSGGQITLLSKPTPQLRRSVGHAQKHSCAD